MSTASAQPPERVRVLVRYKSAPGLDAMADVAGRGADIAHRFDIVPAMALSIPVNALEGLRNNPNVDIVEPDGFVTAVDAELDAVWGVRRIGADLVHLNGNRGAGVRVAVVDTGIDCNHPDLRANCVGGYDFVNRDSDPFDDNGHGTHVAGTIAAADNGTGVVGVAPEATLYGLKVLSQYGGGYWSDIIAAIDWAAANGIQVTNNSYGGGSYPGTIVEEAFARSAAQGVLHIAAAGNSGSCAGTENSVGYPARFSSVVAVAATMTNDGRPCFSSTGPAVELAAPGVTIYSTMPGGGYASLSGTSMASPHAAGVAALVIASGITSNDAVRQRLIDTADDLGTAGLDTHFGHGLVDPNEAVDIIPVDDPPLVTITSPMDGSRAEVTDTFTFTALAVDPEDGDVAPTLEWSSDLDGPLGTGGSFTGPLSLGVHTIVATAIDGRGQSGSDTILVTVTEPVDPNAVIVSSITYLEGEPVVRRRHVRIPLDVTAKLVDGAGNPVVRARVVIVIKNGRAKWRRRGWTDENGLVTFRIPRSRVGCHESIIRRVLRTSPLVWDRVTPANQYCRN